MPKIPEFLSQKYQSLSKLPEMNQELHLLSDLITTIQAKLPPRSGIVNQFKECEELIRFMEAQLTHRSYASFAKGLTSVMKIKLLNNVLSTKWIKGYNLLRSPEAELLVTYWRNSI